MSEIEVKIRDDKAMLYTPYNPEFVKRIKKFSDARWNSGEKCWTIDESNLDAARVIMKEIYGYADNEINEKVTLKIHVKESVSKKHGDVILLGGILFLVHGNEVLSLVGGSYEEFMEFQSAYTVHWEGCKYAIENGYKRYNFYGITGDFREENPLYGLYLFKRGYGGRVVELIGEFDLVISKFWYHTYKCAFSLYHKIKNIKNRD